MQHLVLIPVTHDGLKPGSGGVFIFLFFLRTWLLKELVKEAEAAKASRKTKQLINSGEGKNCLFSSLRRKVVDPRYTINVVVAVKKSVSVLILNGCLFVCFLTAQERINEMEAKLDKLLATLDRAVKIEMMKLPQSLHTTLIKDILSGRFTVCCTK